MGNPEKDQDNRQYAANLLFHLFKQVCALFAQGALLTLFVGKLHEWADRVPIIGFWQALSLTSLWYVAGWLDRKLRVDGNGTK